MGLQLIFLVEARKQSKSDWVYIKETIEHFYEFDKSNVKLACKYMNGKGSYKNAKIEKEIKKDIREYEKESKTNISGVICCFDCDDYDKKPEDSNFLETAKKYCDYKGYEFVWFCKDIEHVYIGNQIDDSKKKKKAADFKVKKLIEKLDSKRLKSDCYKTETSNLMNVLAKYAELKLKK